MNKYDLLDETKAEKMREDALVLMGYLTREDTNLLQEEFAKHRRVQEANKESFDPWYVWLMSRIKVKVTVDESKITL